MSDLNLLRFFEQEGPFIEERIQNGIRQNRMGCVRLKIIDSEGLPVQNADVEVKQISHDFKFGCNIFMLDEYEDEVKNQEYKNAFKKLFNLAVVPFYWATLEPKSGHLRFGKDSEKIFRRPAPDLVLEFCKQNGIEPKGHTLMWQQIYPDWLPKDKEAVKPFIIKRTKEIAERYKDNIKAWDVVNEALFRKYFIDVVLPDDYVNWTFKQAERFFTDNNLFINEVASYSWNDFSWEDSPYYMLIENLLLKGARLDGIGMQYHLFSPKEQLNKNADTYLNPVHLFRVLDQYSDFKLPVHVSEITIPSYSNEEGDEKIQAELTRNLYRLWFSHVSVEAIIWWNLNEGTAWNGEEQWKGGLLRENLTPKPAYDVIHDLVNKEWRTNMTLKSENGADVKFKGFYGNYQLKVRHKGGEEIRHIHIGKALSNEFEIRL